MRRKKSIKIQRFRGIFAGFLVLIGLVVGSVGVMGGARNAYAEPNTTNETTTTTETTTNTTTNDGNSASSNASTTTTASTADACKKSLGSLGWIVCPMMNKISEAVDWLYGKIQEIIVINPVEAKDGTPIYEIWKYCLSVANVMFIIFLLIVIYSQITGWGINNYGVKKALPKLIVMAILVNLSFLICSLAVDVSNIVGNSLRGVFETVEQTALTNMGGQADTTTTAVSVAEAYTSMAGGLALTVGAGAIAFETGAIWMLIPTVLGAIVAVAVGLITIALRQAVVMLLVMISPLAFVANILPNTEPWFQKWKKLLTQMLVFYPMFSLLFGASSLAGFAIIMSAKNGFWLLLGIAVQIFPLFFSWKLMKMSGTFLGSINAKLQGLASKPVAKSRSLAEGQRQMMRQKKLAAARPIMPSTRLMQFMNNRNVAKAEELSEYAETAKLRGLAYAAQRNYKKGKGDLPSKEGEESYERQAKNMEYMRIVERHKNNLNKGLGQLEAVKMEATEAQKVRLGQLDLANVTAADTLKMEKARGEKIAYENARGFHKRMENAMNAHYDDLHAGEKGYKPHDMSERDRGFARAQYTAMRNVMENDMQGVHYAAASAAQEYDSQKKIIQTKMQKYYELTPPTKDVEFRLSELTNDKGALNNIDSIIAGLRVLNQRGDTDILKAQMDNLLAHKVQLGTHASQELASFLMFEVKDNDPWLRRFGKYINLETARVYNKNERQVMEVTYDEYVKGYHDGEPITAENPTGRMYAKKGMKELMEGTPIDNIERTALSNYDDSLIKAYTDNSGKLDYDGYIKRREEIDTAFGPAFISASLKYLSGSEQIASAVRSKTGYGSKQKSDGTYEMEPIWENPKYKKIFAGHEDDIRHWYQKKTLKYLLDQTPSQILGLRSDYFVPLSEHLADAYENSDMAGWSDEAKAERKEIMDEWAELQTKYGDLSTEEARTKYNTEANKLRKKMVGAQFRQLLDSKGKLNQIYRTRRSGAANNAKDWVRDWLDLDNEASINLKLNNDRDKMNKELKKIEKSKESDATDADGTRSRVYDEADMSRLTNYIDDLWNDLKDEDDKKFFDESFKYVNKELGRSSYIAHSYKRFHDDDPYADTHMLKEYLLDLLSDLDNY